MLLTNAASSGTGGYTPEFEEDLKEFAFTIKDYGTVALSFFGITFLGGIFDLRRNNTEEGLLSRYATLIIFGDIILELGWENEKKYAIRLGYILKDMGLSTKKTSDGRCVFLQLLLS